MKDPLTIPPAAERDYERQLREINDALLVSSVHQHELTEHAQKAEAALRESEERLALELAATQRLQEISTQLIREENVEAFHEEILDAAAAILRSDMASLQVVDEGQDALRMLAWRGFDPAFGRIFELVGPDTKTSCSVARHVGHRVIVPDVETCDFIAGTPALEDHRKTGIRAVQSTPLVSRGGQLLGMISTYWHQPHQPLERDLRLLDVLARQAADLIERSQVEEKLRELAQDLERRVAERTRELQQANAALLRDMEERKNLEEQLLQAQKMESIGTLAGGIAHDFNNILNIIQGYASMLRGHSAENKQDDENLNVIIETVQRGSAVVQQLLTLARKSSTKLELVNANVLVERLVALIRQTFPKTVELSCALEADLPPIMADKNQIEQALLNLCLNARDAMSDGGRLTLKTQLIDGVGSQESGAAGEERYVCFEVSDTGVGMNESDRKRIFEPFFTTKSIGQGTGLGLFVVYGIVKHHHGFINVDSQPMAGTSFRLHFPIATCEESYQDPVLKLDPEITTTPNHAATVLLVEDEQSMLYLLENLFLKHGYRVLTASDGEVAVEIYQRHKKTIDVVLLDLGLPKISGQDVLLKMKNENPNVKVVIASGYLEPQMSSEIEQAGVKYFLQKPYKFDEVLKTFQSLIEKKS